MTTTAEKISERYNDDGQCFRDENDVFIADACGAECDRELSQRADVQKYIFSDKSAIVIAGGGWDFALCPEDDDCFCWEGNREHTEACANRHREQANE